MAKCTINNDEYLKLLEDKIKFENIAIKALQTLRTGRLTYKNYGSICVMDLKSIQYAEVEEEAISISFHDRIEILSRKQSPNAYEVLKYYYTSHLS